MDTCSTDHLKERLREFFSTGLLEQTGTDDSYSDDLLVLGQSRGLHALQGIQSIYQGVQGDEDSFKGIIKSSCAASMVLCVTFLGDYEWSNNKCRTAAKDLLESIVSTTGSPSVFRLLCGYSEVEDPPDGALYPRGILPEISRLLKMRMNKEDWRKEPASRQVFCWVLSQMKHPFVGEHLSLLLPPALLLVDDYQLANKLLGVKCLQHLINEVDRTELRWYGRGEVVYQALEPLLYQQDAGLMVELLPCILSILAVTEQKQTEVPRRPNRYDKVFQIILCNMEGEQKIALRRVFARFLDKFVGEMKIHTLNHMKRLMRVIAAYLEVGDGKDEISRLCTLNALKTVIIETWPRIPAHLVHLTKVLLVLIVDVDQMDSFNITESARQEMRSKAEECLILLGKCNTETMKKVLDGILETATISQSLKDSIVRVSEEG